MANYTTSADLLDDILNRAGEKTDGTSDFNAAAIRYLNRAYQGIWKGGGSLDPEVHETWWWIRKDDQGVLTLDPVIDTGTVSVTNNSTSITFSSGPTPSVAGRHIKIDDHADVFVISAHSAGQTSATLESVYTGSTDATASYKVMHLDYDLAGDVLYLSSPMKAFQDGRKEIPGIDLNSLSEKYPLNHTAAGVPKNFAFLSQSKVRFSHYGGSSSTDLIKIDYEYAAEPSDLADDSNEPLVPREYRFILADWALMFIYADKDDTRVGDTMVLAQRGLVAMAKENRRRMSFMGGNMFGKIVTRQKELDRFTAPLRTESGLIIG